MKRAPAIITASTCRAATDRAIAFGDHLSQAIDRSSSSSAIQRHLVSIRDAFKADVRQAARLRAQRCKTCEYREAIAGAAVTTRPCGLCLTIQTYGSTAANALCRSCAAEHALCVSCGGDINSDQLRDKYPTSSNLN